MSVRHVRRIAIEPGNVWILSVAVLSLIFAARVTALGGYFTYTGIDFRSFWASADIALRHGFDEVYDLQLQEAVQRPMWASHSPVPLEFYSTVPMPYLPVFLLPFIPLALIPPLPAFAIWTVANTVGGLVYLRRLLGTGVPPPNSLLSLAVACPFLLTLLAGQVNVWLLVCFGEFMLAMMAGRQLVAGAWLAGVLIKPQLLIVVLPGLLIARQTQVVASFGALSALVVVVSMALAGTNGMLALAKLLLGYSAGPAGLPTNFPESMMNWRALAVHLQAFMTWNAALVIAVAGMLGTAMTASVLWYRGRNVARDTWPVLMLGTLAASNAIAWHSHVHTALPLLAPLAVLYAAGWIPPRLYRWWVLWPATIFLLIALPLSTKLGHNLVGLGMLAVNLHMLAWSIWTVGLAHLSGARSAAFSSRP